MTTDTPTLIDAYLDGELTAEQHTALNTQLESDADLRRRFIEATYLHHRIHQQIQVTSVPAADDTESKPENKAPSVRPIGRFITAGAIAAAVMITTAIVLLFVTESSEVQSPAPPPHTPQSVAMITEMQHASFARSPHPTTLGSELKAGELTLASGSAQVMFHSGSVVDLAGPCALELAGTNQAILRHGTIAAYVPPRASGFTIETPRGLRVIDRGTRFDMHVNPEGGTNILVREGRVELQWGRRHQMLEAGVAAQVLDGKLTVYQRDAAESVQTLVADFESDDLPAELEDPAGVYRFTGGQAESAGPRHYIRTRTADYNTRDFAAEITYTMPTQTAGPNIVFFGVGGGEPDPTEWNNPIPAVYFESSPLRIEFDRGAGEPDQILHRFDPPGPGTHRLRITKVDRWITFEVDRDATGDRFVADESHTLLWDSAAAFLNETNSRIFFGTEQSESTSTFDNLRIDHFKANRSTHPFMNETPSASGVELTSPSSQEN